MNNKQKQIMDMPTGTIIRRKDNPKRRFNLGAFVNDKVRKMIDLYNLGMTDYINYATQDEYEVEEDDQ